MAVDLQQYHMPFVKWACRSTVSYRCSKIVQYSLGISAQDAVSQIKCVLGCKTKVEVHGDITSRVLSQQELCHS